MKDKIEVGDVIQYESWYTHLIGVVVVANHELLEIYFGDLKMLLSRNNGDITLISKGDFK